MISVVAGFCGQIGSVSGVSGSWLANLGIPADPLLPLPGSTSEERMVGLIKSGDSRPAFPLSKRDAKLDESGKSQAEVAGFQ